MEGYGEVLSLIEKKTPPPRGETRRDSYSSQATRRSFCEGPPCSLSSVDQTAHFLIATWNPRRPWPEQVRTHSGKCPLTTATVHAQASGEPTTMHENRSHPPRAFSQGGSSMETSPPHRPARDTAAVASGALPPVLETQVKGLFTQAEGRRGNDRIDQRDGEGKLALGSREDSWRIVETGPSGL
jgi:hypothetical protein